MIEVTDTGHCDNGDTDIMEECSFEDVDGIVSTWPGSVTVTSGLGPHMMTIERTKDDVTVSADLDLNGGGVGSSEVIVHVVDTEGNVEVTTGNGEDEIDLDGTQGDQTITTKGGSDTIYIRSVDQDTTLIIDAGEEDNMHSTDDGNFIEIEGLIDANLNVMGGHGSDIITINTDTEQPSGRRLSVGGGSYTHEHNYREGEDFIIIDSTPQGSVTTLYAVSIS